MEVEVVKSLVTMGMSGDFMGGSWVGVQMGEAASSALLSLTTLPGNLTSLTAKLKLNDSLGVVGVSEDFLAEDGEGGKSLILEGEEGGTVGLAREGEERPVSLVLEEERQRCAGAVEGFLARDGEEGRFGGLEGEESLDLVREGEECSISLVLGHERER